jgi:myosin heavy subunit
MENNKSGAGNAIKLGIIVVLLLICGGAIYMLVSENKVNDSLTADKAALQQSLNSLNDTLNEKKAELEQMKGKNESLDSIIVIREAQIDKQKGEIAALLSKEKLTVEELDKAKQMINQDEAAVSDFQKQLDDLNQKNKELMNQNAQLSTDLTTEKKTSAQLNEKNKNLFTKGSLLQLKNLTIEGIKKKKNDKEVVEKKAKKVESLKISFETGENKVLEPGNLSLYIRIINPKGEVISVSEHGSGTIKAATGTEIQYTKKVDTDWDQTNKKVDVYWTQDINNAGVYTVEVYQNGYVIGNGSTELK